MNEGLFWSSYSESIALLKRLQLLKSENVHKRIPYSPYCNDYSRGKDYHELYQRMVDNRDFDILLRDDSLIQMSINDGMSRFLFIQNPLEYISFESFMEDNGLEIDNELINEYHAYFDDDYEQLLESANLNSGAVYLRYDVDAQGRIGNEGIHAYTHLHIGLNNQIRIPVGIYLTPLAFIVFILRHVYYDVWVDAVRMSKINFDYKKQCEKLPDELWSEEERKDLFIG